MGWGGLRVLLIDGLGDLGFGFRFFLEGGEIVTGGRGVAEDGLCMHRVRAVTRSQQQALNSRKRPVSQGFRL